MDTEYKENNLQRFRTEKLFLFYSSTQYFQNVFKDYRLLKSLIIIGQHIESLEGIESMSNLEELWIVESGLKQESIGPVSGCLELKRLYLYSNELSAIPNLSRLDNLVCLYLSDNQIDSLQNINNLLVLKELYIGNNNITKIDIKFKSILKIECLNLSGNPLSCLRELQKLTSLRRLRWLIMSDLLYKCSPVTLLANFQLFVIYCLPNLQKLDLKLITPAERKRSVEFFETKLQYYRLILRSDLAKIYAERKTDLESKSTELQVIWSALHSHGPVEEKAENENNNKLRFWEGEAQRWKERKELCLHNYKKLVEVTTEKTQLELEHCGNLSFKEINLVISDIKEKFKIKLDSFLCNALKINILEINLLNVWTVQGPHKLTVMQSLFKDTWDDVYILCPVQDLNVEPLKSVEQFLFGNKLKSELSVANCLANADTLVSNTDCIHRQLLLRSHNLLKCRLFLLCGVVCDTQLTKQVGKTTHHSSGCHLLCLTDPTALVPLYLVNFQYVFEDYFKPLRALSARTSLPKSVVFPPRSQNITKVVLSNADIHHLDIPVMENATFVDLSYNHLHDISTISHVFPKLTSLNLAFNKVTSLDRLECIKNLTQLVLKWNFLTNFTTTLKKLKDMNLLKQLDLSWNPFQDVISNKHELFFVCKHLKTLVSYNGHSMPQSSTTDHILLDGQDQFPMVPVLSDLLQPLTVHWKSDLCNKKTQNYLGVKGNDIVCATLQDLELTQFQSVFSLNKLKWLDLSNNLISSALVLKCIPKLEEVNLSGNVLKEFTCSNGKFGHLTKLNLSYNYITSLRGFSCHSFPHLKLLDLSNNSIKSLVGMSGLKTVVELYLSHNLLQECDTLEHCKTWQDLKVLDLSYNPLTQISMFRHSCVYLLSTLKYLNGSKISEEEKNNSLIRYGGLLNQDYLTRIYSTGMLSNLRHLYLPKCSIEKVELPDVTLTNVTSVTLDHNKITSLCWLHVFPRLARLSLSHNRVCNYYKNGVSNMSQPSATLHTLVLDHNRICHLSPLCLDLFPNLRMLVLNDNEISSLSGLNNMMQLEQLVLDRNKLSSISVNHSENVKNLLELYLERNLLTKLDFLQGLKKLQKLFVGFNNLVTRACLSPLSELPELQELTVHGNPVFRSTNSFKDLPHMPALQLLEGHPVNMYT